MGIRKTRNNTNYDGLGPVQIGDHWVGTISADGVTLKCSHKHRTRAEAAGCCKCRIDFLVKKLSKQSPEKQRMVFEWEAQNGGAWVPLHGAPEE